MLARCANCNSRMLVTGEELLHWKFCSAKCATKFRDTILNETVSPEEVEQQIRQVFEGPCPLCGTAGRNDLYSATKVTAYLIFFKVNTESYICCSSCAKKKRLKAAMHCSLAGWWGIKAAAHNLFYLPSNLIAAAFTKVPTAPSEELTQAVKTRIAESMAAKVMTLPPPAASEDEQPTATPA